MKIRTGLVLLLIMLPLIPTGSAQQGMPPLYIEELVVIGDEIQEKQNFSISFVLKNNGSMPLDNLLLRVEISQFSVRPGQSQAAQVIGSKTIESIAASTEIEQNMELEAPETGTFLLQVVIVYNNVDLPALNGEELVVEMTPVGDNATLLMVLGIFFVFLLVLIILPSFVDRMRVKRR